MRSSAGEAVHLLGTILSTCNNSESSIKWDNLCKSLPTTEFLINPTRRMSLILLLWDDKYMCVCVCTHPPNAQPHSPPHTCTCTPTTPHSTVRKDSHVALRAGLDKGCYFVQCFWSPSRQAWLLPQSKQGTGRTFWSLRSTPVFLLFITQHEGKS